MRISDWSSDVCSSDLLLTAMGKYNEELAKAGIMLAGEGLHPSSKGARVRFSGTKRTVVDGPLVETKETVAGFWRWQGTSKKETIAWAKGCPIPWTGASVLEIRQVFKAEVFGEKLMRELREQPVASYGRYPENKETQDR